MALWKDPVLKDHGDGDFNPILMNFVHLITLIVTCLDHCVNDGSIIEILWYNWMVCKSFWKLHGRQRNTESQAWMPLPEQVADSMAWYKFLGRYCFQSTIRNREIRPPGSVIISNITRTTTGPGRGVRSLFKKFWQQQAHSSKGLLLNYPQTSGSQEVIRNESTSVGENLCMFVGLSWEFVWSSHSNKSSQGCSNKDMFGCRHPVIRSQSLMVFIKE